MSFPTRSKAFDQILDILDRRVDPSAVAKRVNSQDLSDMGELREAIAQLTDDECPGVLLAALFKADNLVAETVWQLRGPFPVDLRSNSAQTSLTLNDQPFSLFRIKDTKQFMSATTVQDLVLTFKHIQRMGVTGLIEAEKDRRSMISAASLDYAFDLVRSVSFRGELPVFAGERVSCPELVDALFETAKVDGPGYDPILCWATPEMLNLYPEQLCKYSSTQQFEVLLRGSGTTKTLTFKEWAESYSDVKGSSLLPDNYVLMGYPEDDSRVGHALLMAMGSPASQHGFIERDGLVLCHTKASFLTEFEMSEFDAANAQLSREFVGQYLPLDFIVDRAFPDGFGHFKPNGFPSDSKSFKSGVRPRSSDCRKGFLELLGHPDMGSQIKGLMNTEQWRHLAQTQALVPSTLIVLHKALGFDNQGLAARLVRSDVVKMHEAGYRFAAHPYRLMTSEKNAVPEDSILNGETWVDMRLITVDLKDAAQTRKGVGLKLVYEQLVAMGLWPSAALAEPKDLPSALASCARRVGVATKFDEASISLRAYVMNAGVEACAEVAGNPKQWAFMLDLFGPDAMRPYSRELPAESLGKVFAHDLGL